MLKSAENFSVFVIFSGIICMFIDLDTTENWTSDRNFLKVSPRSQKVKNFLHLWSDESSDSLAFFAWPLSRFSGLFLFLFESPDGCWTFAGGSNSFGATVSDLLVPGDVSGLSHWSLIIIFLKKNSFSFVSIVEGVVIP